MAKQVLQSDLILEIVARFPQGASVEEILIGLSPPPSRRTLQYRLSFLVERGLLVSEGRTRGKKFRLPPRVKAAPPSHVRSYIALSLVAESLQEAVTLPIQARHPVSYNRDFLMSPITFPRRTETGCMNWVKRMGSAPLGLMRAKFLIDY